MEIEPQYTLFVVRDYKRNAVVVNHNKRTTRCPTRPVYDQDKRLRMRKKWPRGKKKENKSKICRKTQKTIILDKRTAKTELMKNNITKNITIGIARQSLLMGNEY